MKKLLLILAMMFVINTPSRSQSASDEIFLSTFIFGITIPALPIMVDMADLYGLTALAMGGAFSYVALTENSEYFLYGAPLLVSAVYVIRYDTKMEPWKLWVSNGALFAAASFASLPLTEWDRNYGIQVRPYPGGATVRVAF